MGQQAQRRLCKTEVDPNLRCYHLYQVLSVEFLVTQFSIQLRYLDPNKMR